MKEKRFLQCKIFLAQKMAFIAFKQDKKEDKKNVQLNQNQLFFEKFYVMSDGFMWGLIF
jgi:hypothetical protein